MVLTGRLSPAAEAVNRQGFTIGRTLPDPALQGLNCQDSHSWRLPGVSSRQGGLAGLLRCYEVSRWWWPVRPMALRLGGRAACKSL